MPPKTGAVAVQPSISAFFKRKSPPSSPSVPSLREGNALAIVDLTSPPPEKRQRQSSDTSFKESDLAQSKSSYFTSQRETKVAIPEDNAGPSRHRASLSSYALPAISPSQPIASGSAFEIYTISTADQASASQPRSRTAEQQRRHEKWQQRMEGPGGLVPRRRSLALDEAAAREARKAAGLVEEDEEGAETPVLDDVVMVDSDDERKRQDAEGVGSKLSAKFAAKGSDGKSKAKGGGKKKKEEEIGPSGLTYTPLEKQYMEIKAQNPDVLLMMEVGYKYKFHGDDAKNASKELGIAAFPSRNFYTASIPTHRLHIHVKKLISLGYKVGVISQMETAALKKVGENRNAPFTRELTNLFTAATYVEDPSMPSSSTMADDPILPGSAPPPTNALVALVEMGMGGLAFDDRVRIGFVSVVPGTGEVIWDEFDDSQVRTELETRLTHLQPAEMLLPASGLSKATEKVLSHFAGDSRAGKANTIRVERIQKIASYDSAFDYLTRFYNRQSDNKDKSNSNGLIPDTVDMTGDSEDESTIQRNGQFNGNDQSSLAKVEGMDDPVDEDPLGLAAGLPSDQAVLALIDFPKQIVVALCIAVKYMKTFGLENAFRHRSSFVKFINRAHMLLSSNTLVNLEIYRNQTDGGVYGSLLWLLDHARTRMGRRLMREWIGRPLLDVGALQARVDAIEEIMDNNSYHMEKLRSLLVNMPDLVKGLTRIQYGKATPTEMATILVGLNRVGSEFKSATEDLFSSSLLNTIVRILPTIRDAVQDFLNSVNIKQARDNDEANLWADPDKYPDIQDAKDCISICESELDTILKDIRKLLKRPSLAYVTVSGIEYLVEVPVKDAKSVPHKWVKISATKSAVRYHTPEILNVLKEREQHKEILAAAAHQALLSFQSDISENHALVVVARQIAVIDCLMSLAQVAAASGYCKPQFVAEPCLHIREGRHPMVEMLRDEAYVPFDIVFSQDDGTAKVITGPNMAGKSSCVRATALIVCMAQIGSFVPAQSVKLGIHDAVQTRMGASDEIERGKSTFMVELSETSDILRTITPRTLVILDELGRGTSTYDGVAIAYATLSHVAAQGCNTLFVTHYPMVAKELAKELPKQISNWHMSFEEIKLPDGSAEITFLYKLTPGLAEASFGVWCARLAGLPKAVLENAQLRADQLKHETAERLEAALTKRSHRLLVDLGDAFETVKTRRDSHTALKNAMMLHKALRSKYKT